MVSADFVGRLAERAAEAEQLRRLPPATIEEYRESGLARLLLPARYGGRQAELLEIFDVVRRMAHGCASSAWTLGFYTLHNWMLALFGEQAQDEVFADGPVLCPAPLAPTGRCIPVDGGSRLTGRWSWATGVMDADWVLVGAICGPDQPDRAPYPALVLLPAADIRVEDVWHTAGSAPPAPTTSSSTTCGYRGIGWSPWPTSTAGQRRARHCTMPRCTDGRWCPRWR